MVQTLDPFPEELPKRGPINRDEKELEDPESPLSRETRIVKVRVPERTIRDITERTLFVTPDDIRVYRPNEDVQALAGAMVSGAIMYQEMADRLGWPLTKVRKAFEDPVAIAWACQESHKAISTRLGQVDAAVFRRALAGDVRAAKLLYERYGEMVQRVETISSKGPDYSKFSTEDLLSILVHERRQVRDVEAEVVDEQSRSDETATSEGVVDTPGTEGT
jgi:hypothetical protein